MYKKRVTLKDIALASGVSTTTVSVILNGRSDVRIGEKTRIRVLAAADKLAYSITPPRKKNTSPIVCFVHGTVEQINIGTSFYGRVSSHLRSLCEDNDFGFLEFEYNEKEKLHQYQTILAYQPVAFVTASSEFCQFHETQNNDIPLFMLQGERLTPGETRKSSLLLVDDYSVGQLGARHLIERGFQSCGMIFPDVTTRCLYERSKSFSETFSSLGGVCEHLIFNLNDHQGLEQWFRNWDRTRFDSFYFFSDSMAIPGIRGLQLQGCRIPENAGILGTDNLYWGQFAFPSLTTMELHESFFAERICEEIKTIVGGGKFFPGEIVIPVELIHREST